MFGKNYRVGKNYLIIIENLDLYLWKGLEMLILKNV